MNRLLIICGPTATGKTALAAKLAKIFKGELISADSRQVYRGMDIVTGKDRPDVPIWLYDVVDPDEEFSVSHWVKLAKHAIIDIQKRKKLPIVVGGAGLYINALIHPIETIDIPPNQDLRKQLQTLFVGDLQKMVERSDMNDSDWQNPRRLIRKIETATIPKKNLQGESLKVLIIGLKAPLPVLYNRIDERLKERMHAGMEEEAALLQARYDRDLPSMSAIGVNEHAYARRQMTWFKKQKNIHWFDITHDDVVKKIASVVRAWYN